MTRAEAEKATLDPIDYALQAVKASGKKVLVAGSIGPLIDKPGCEYNPEYLERLSRVEYFLIKMLIILTEYKYSSSFVA